MAISRKLNSFRCAILVTDWDYKLKIFHGVLRNILSSLCDIATAFSGKPCKDFVPWNPQYHLLLILGFIHLSQSVHFGNYKQRNISLIHGL